MIKTDELNFDKSGDGFIPVIVQHDTTLKVLMLGYMNRESYEKSVESGLVTFYSRSRQQLWTKGETSGNYLHIKSISKDCDADTLLVRVEPDGVVCHTGSVSCFGGDDNEGFVRTLQAIVQQRHAAMPDGSYTSSLFRSGVKRCAQKVGEEAVETVIEAVDGNKTALLYEASDLIYHLLVLLECSGLSLSDIERELAGRHPRSAR